jgi:hypothetical protein
MAMPNDAPAPPRASFLAGAGQVLFAIVKHVPTRGVLWGALGLVIGLLADAASFILGLLVLDRGAMILGYGAIVFVLVPLAGVAIFFVHGLHRGAARAALEIERKLGLVRWVVDRVLAFVDARVGGALHDMPIADFERRLGEATKKYLGSADAREGNGITGFVLRRAKRRIAKRIAKYTLAAYRAEATSGGGGGGISLAKISDRVGAEMSTRLSEIVMSPLNKTLAILLAVYLVVGIGWWAIILGVLDLLMRFR